MTIAPFQGFLSMRPISQGVALGFRISPLRGLNPRPHRDCASPRRGLIASGLRLTMGAKSRSASLAEER